MNKISNISLSDISLSELSELNAENHGTKIYISLPITGDEDNARKRADIIETKLRLLGFIPINPFQVNHNHDRKHASYMRADLIELLKADVLFAYFDEKWEFSSGCRIENFVCSNLNYNKIYHDYSINRILEILKRNKIIAIPSNNIVESFK